MAQTEPEASSVAPPYIAFRTLTDIVDRMVDEGAPSRVDRSYLDRFSGGYQTQVIAAFESLQLLEANGMLTDRFKALIAADQDERKRLVGEMVRQQYANVLALGTNATQQQLIDEFENMGVRGDTRRKAIAFFLKASEFAEVPTSRHWKTPGAAQRRAARPGSGTRTTSKRGGGTRVQEEEPPAPPSAPASSENVHSIQLKSGETLTLRLTGNLLAMPRDDRTFVFSLIDRMQDYEAGVEEDDSDEEEVEG
jgi:hypothetical protein